jgi:hypothetical protein
VVVLLSESASLTSRETLTVLGSGGVPGRCAHVGRVNNRAVQPLASQADQGSAAGADPFGYLSLVSELCSAGEYEAVLATHEQAWLFAAGRHLLPADAPIAAASAEAFERVAGKVEFAALCDELGVPQPRWWRCDERPDRVPYPHWVKASYGTAGRAVRRVDTTEQEHQAVRELSGPARSWARPLRPASTARSRSCSSMAGWWPRTPASRSASMAGGGLRRRG